ncbi:uncharacterized protein L969DRAFT_14713 [Mixia osmundae IAM 14324]|uniref:G-patch domain-containing protein n=1 Tax=Mixia osmundae (strain CBS 9802 / IAM 14324 / JCM 22182 / KY 12970) TaxID=764103 RepID=G7E309_MIXOS|nr:uncharacterized protein L969DRAFT_14713 [Mixia osmundae IAM 14324]KEI42521.1 hypothetical protein L969DRAFT_14713 [Mixia osmundae IAM 14324]GAA97190.1 hypothetical protein E5Q_03866 [Mixia osmundae IAM 14324]
MSSLKRESPDDQDSDGASSSGYGSIVSRSPSPETAHSSTHAGKRRAVTPDYGQQLPIKADNVGQRLLERMGWQAGQGLGLNGQGRIEPIQVVYKADLMGLGKVELERDMLDNASLRQRTLDSIKLARETDEQRAAREARVAREAAVKAEIVSAIEKFHCQLCDKAYVNVRQYDEHLNSYDHHHKKRFLELKAESRAAAAVSGQLDKRKEKERKREEREFARLAQAAGVMQSQPVQPIRAIATENAMTAAAPAQKSSGGFKRIAVTVPVRTAPLHSDSSVSALDTKSPITTTPSSTAAEPVADAAVASTAPTFRPSAFRRIPAVAPRAQPELPTADQWRPPDAEPLHPLLSGAAEVEADSIDALLDANMPARKPRPFVRKGGTAAWSNFRKGKT